MEPATFPTNDAKVVTSFEKEHLYEVGKPRAIISDEGFHFCNQSFEDLLTKYGVKHRVANAWHPQTSGGAEI